MDLATVQGLGSEPIRSDNPGGDAYRDESEFETLQSEIGRLERAEGEQPHWDEVVRISALILREKSKDILAASYLAVGLLHLQGYQGFSAGLGVMADLVDTHWDVLHPPLKRMRGRMGALDWLAERGAAAVQRRGPTPGEAEAVAACREQIERLGGRLGELAAGEADRLSPLLIALREAAEKAQREQAPPPPPPATPTPAATSGEAATAAQPGAPSAPAGLGRDVSDQSGAAHLLAQIRDASARLASFHRSTDPKNPIGYALPRAVAWAHLHELPPSTDGKTRIPGYQPADLGQKLEELAGQGQWPGVLEQTESRFLSSILWLDLQRHAVRALEASGADYQPAADAIVHELAGLLRRAPGLDQLEFANGVPLADATTRAWIRDRVASAGVEGPAAPPAAGPAPAAADGDELVSADLETFDEVRREAAQLAQKRRLPEAIRMLEERASGCRTLRGRAQWLLEMGRLTFERGSASAAYGQLQALEELVDRGGLDEWDPRFSREFLKWLFLSHEKVLSSLKTPPPDEESRSMDLRRRLCRLDPAAAAELMR